MIVGEDFVDGGSIKFFEGGWIIGGFDCFSDEIRGVCDRVGCVEFVAAFDVRRFDFGPIVRVKHKVKEFGLDEVEQLVVGSVLDDAGTAGR